MQTFYTFDIGYQLRAWVVYSCYVHRGPYWDVTKYSSPRFTCIKSPTTCMHKNIRTYVRTCIRTYMRTYMYIHTYMHTHTHTHTHTHIYIYIYILCKQHTYSLEPQVLHHLCCADLIRAGLALASKNRKARRSR